MYLAEKHLLAGLEIARQLFAQIGKESFDGSGFTRAAYGAGEQAAHDAVVATARALGLRVEVDAALNTAMVLPGRDPSLGAVLIGSHLDAVPNGGNFDGLAGVLAGMAVVAAIGKAGIQPERDLVVLAIRSEESAWFGAQHIGSRARLGTLSPTVLDAANRVDTGRSLRSHMAEAGADLRPIEAGLPLADTTLIRAYLELHIEQGEVLTRHDVPLGIVTGIRGNRRCRRILCKGEYGHSGSVERADRHDAVFAVAELVMEMDALWQAVVDEGDDMVLTFGRFTTDPTAHSVTTVPGAVEFSFDVRSHSPEVLTHTEVALISGMDRIARKRGVRFSHDAMTGDIPVAMDDDLQTKFDAAAKALNIPTMPITSGAGHDAGDFGAAGVPAAMLFIRSENGSHNPDEHMEFDDFALGVRVLARVVGDLALREVT